MMQLNYYRVEPTQLVQQERAEPIESSYGNEESYLRAANPFRLTSIYSAGTSFISLASVIASSVISSILTPISTVTKTTSVYPATVTSTIYTMTKTYILKGCIPTSLLFNPC